MARRWFTLFFIPVIPYESGHLMICPVCGHGMELDKAQQQAAGEMTALNKQFGEGQISEGEYETRAAMIRLWETYARENGVILPDWVSGY